MVYKREILQQGLIFNLIGDLIKFKLKFFYSYRFYRWTTGRSFLRKVLHYLLLTDLQFLIWICHLNNASPFGYRHGGQSSTLLLRLHCDFSRDRCRLRIKFLCNSVCGHLRHHRRGSERVAGLLISFPMMELNSLVFGVVVPTDNLRSSVVQLICDLVVKITHLSDAQYVIILLQNA